MVKKKKKHMPFVILTLLLLIAAAGGGYYYYQYEYLARQAQETMQEQMEMTAGENQSILYGQIEDIVGNEVRLTVVEYKAEGMRTSYEPTGEERDYQIPVGTEVETKLGAVTTFSRLSSGDVLRILMESTPDSGEVIVRIQIVE